MATEYSLDFLTVPVGKFYDIERKGLVDTPAKHVERDFRLTSTSKDRLSKLTNVCRRVVGFNPEEMSKLRKVLEMYTTRAQEEFPKWLKVDTSKWVGNGNKYLVCDPEFRIAVGEEPKRKLATALVVILRYYGFKPIEVAGGAASGDGGAAGGAGAGALPENPALAELVAPGVSRKKCWDQYFKGQTEGRCFCCLSLVTITGESKTDYEASHIFPKAWMGEKPDRLENLVVACKACNRTMGEMHLYEFIKIQDKTGMVNVPKDSKDWALIVALDTAIKALPPALVTKELKDTSSSFHCRFMKLAQLSLY
jgi:hypothetical protein